MRSVESRTMWIDAIMKRYFIQTLGTLRRRNHSRLFPLGLCFYYRCTPDLHLLFNIVQLLPELSVGFLQVHHLLAKVLEIIHWFARGAQVGDGPIGGVPL